MIRYGEETTVGPLPLVEVTRGGIAESVHYGVAAVCDAEGSLLAWAGDPNVVTFYRSACKPIQAVALVESGAADHFGLTDQEIALVCGSHGGEPRHIEAALSILSKAGLGPEALACGSHYPLEPGTARRMRSSGETPTAIHNNCSGKHSGMLALARFHGWPAEGYRLPDHPVQKLMRGIIAEFAGVLPEELVVGIDGCGISNFAVPVRRMAVSFARFATPDYWQGPRREAVTRIARAMTAYPDMVGYSEGNIDTDAMRAGSGRLVSKRGAEGVYCAARIAAPGAPALGVAMKLIDGDEMGRARNAAIVELLSQAGIVGDEEQAALSGYRTAEVRNRPGDLVGVVRAVLALDRLPVENA